MQKSVMLKLGISTHDDRFKIMKIFTFSTLFLLLTFSNAFAALTVIQHSGEYLASQSTAALNITQATGSGNLLVVMVYYDTSTTVTNVTDGTNNFTQFSNGVFNFGSNGIGVWYLPKSVSGKTTVTATLSAPPFNVTLEFWEVSGFINPGPDVAASISSGVQSGGAATGAAVTPSSSNDFIVAGDSTNGDVTVNPKAGNVFTSGGDITGGGFTGYVSYISTSTASAQPAWTDDGTSFVSETAAFKNITIVQRINNARINNAKLGY